MNKEYLDYDGLRHYHTNVAVMVDSKLETVKNDLTTAIDQKEAVANKVGSWQSTPDDTHYPTEKLVKDSLDGKANSSHTHAISEVTSLQSSLDGKSDTGHTHTRSQITDFPSSLPASDVYSWAKSSSKPSYSISEISGLQSTLDGKASVTLIESTAAVTENKQVFTLPVLKPGVTAFYLWNVPRSTYVNPIITFPKSGGYIVLGVYNKITDNSLATTSSFSTRISINGMDVPTISMDAASYSTSVIAVVYMRLW